MFWLSFICHILSLKKHIGMSCIKSKMCAACCATQNIKFLVSQGTFRIIYLTHICSILSYGIIFGGNSSYSNKVFMLKKIISIIMNTGTTDSCRELFKDMTLLPMYSQYRYSLILHKVNNKHYIIHIMRFINMELGTIIIYTCQ